MSNNHQHATNHHEDEQFVASTATILLNGFLIRLWQDGTLSIEQDQEVIDLSRSQARKLRKQLNQRDTKKHLGIVQIQAKPHVENPVVELGQRVVEMKPEGGLILGTTNGPSVELDAGEEYRLYVLLREKYLGEKGA